MRARKTHSGFSLTELIVAITLFSVLSLAIFAVFISSMRAVRTANQAMEANEMVRGAFNVLQRDLTTAFTSRDAGEYYQFFGAPSGMMFIGLVEQDGVMQLGRVTYVIRPAVYDPALDAWQPDSILAEEYEDPDITINGDEVTVDQPVDTYALVRFVEIGVEDLDTFPGAEWDDWETSAENPYPALRNELDDVRDYANLEGLSAEDTEVLLSAKKRELWLRMLSGTERSSLPDGWAFIRNDLGEAANLGPIDYVLMENIVARIAEADRSYHYGEYGLLTSDPSLWGALADPNVSLPPEHWRREPEVGEGLFYYDLAERPFFEYGRVGSAMGSGLASAAAAADLYYEWNTFDTAVNPVYMDGDGDPSDPSNPPVLEPLGDPLRPRLPEVVRVRLAVRFESPYVGARDFVRELDQIIDIPSGYTRADLTTDRRDPTDLWAP